MRFWEDELNTYLDKYFELTQNDDDYRSDINHLMESVNNEVSNLNLFSYADFVRTLGMNIKNGSIGTKEKAKRYYYVVKSYVEYLILSRVISEGEFYKNINLPEYEVTSTHYKILNHIENHNKLEDKKEFSMISDEDYGKLVNEASMNYIIFCEKPNSEKHHNWFVFSIVTKLMMQYGISYKKIRDLEINSYVGANRILRVGKYNIFLDSDISRDIEVVIDLRIHGNPYLLPIFTGEQLSDKTTGVSDYLNRVIGRTDTNGLVKYALKNMIDHDIPYVFINKLTGIGKRKYNSVYYQNNFLEDELLLRYNHAIQEHVHEMTKV
jgi:hypothetical protein